MIHANAFIIHSLRYSHDSLTFGMRLLPTPDATEIRSAQAMKNRWMKILKCVNRFETATLQGILDPTYLIPELRKLLVNCFCNSAMSMRIGSATIKVPADS